MPPAFAQPRAAMLESMLRIRAYEATLASIASALEPIACTSVGHEACAVGLIAALEPHDRILTDHRSAAHLLARGASPARLMAEVLGRSNGYCKGKSGSLHISAKELGVVLTSTIVGGALSMATGVALAQKLGYGVPGGVVAVVFDDGDACQGIFHESLNLAVTWDLPALYVCENNQFQRNVHREAVRGEYISTWAQKFDMPALIVDGNDVEAVHTTTRAAIAQIRRTSQPFFIELQTYPQRAHTEPAVQRHVDRADLHDWEKRDPIAIMTDRLLKAVAMSQADITQLDESAHLEMKAALAFAQSSPWPSTTELTNDVYA